MSNEISHVGTIESIEGDMVHVRIVQSSACSSCKVSSYCSSAESKEKIIDVRVPELQDSRDSAFQNHRYVVGQSVMVMAANSVGMKAVVLAFVIPSILLLAVIFGMTYAGYSEAVAALSGLLSLVPYYIILYLLRSKLEKVLTFYLK